MDDPPSEGNERVADIFIASTDGSTVALLREHLEKNNHLVTVFTDDAQLNDTLLSGKPKLLIYDGTTGGQERYAVIHRIKADGDLWSIPVIALSAASTMHDLLHVLESNADNFIAPPYDHPDHLSLIEGMLATPVERPTAEDLKKQFNVRQDDQTYVISAPRRKLLEYLLSSFDTLVSKSSDLSSVNSKFLELSGSVRDLEQVVTGKNENIELLNATARQYEQKIAALTEKCDGLEKVLAQKTAEIKNLAAESDNKKTSLDTMENALMEEETRSASLEKALRDLTSDFEQQKSALIAEKNRSQLAEQEINTLNQVKKQSESDLNQVIARLKETAEQHAAELARLKSEMETETNRRVLAENQAGERQRELELSRKTHQSETGALTRQVGKLQDDLTASVAALETERELRRVSEEKTTAAVRQQEDFKNQARLANEEMERSNKDQASSISQITEDLHAARLQVQSLEAGISKIASEKSLTEQEVRTLNAELERLETTLVNERKSHQAIEEGHANAAKERHLVQQPLISPDEVPPRKEHLDLVVPEEPHFPTTVIPVSPPVVTGVIPGSIQPPASQKEQVSRESSGEITRVFSGIIPQVARSSDADSIFTEPEPVAKNVEPAPAAIIGKKSEEEKTSFRESLPGQPYAPYDKKMQPASHIDVTPEQKTVEKQVRGTQVKTEHPDGEDAPGGQPGETPGAAGVTVPTIDISFNSTKWLDLLKWAHHTDALSKEQRLKIVRMGRLIQKDRKLTKNQQEQVREILSMADSLGYQPR